jgi:SAM-dependent methyltransferase
VVADHQGSEHQGGVKIDRPIDRLCRKAGLRHKRAMAQDAERIVDLYQRHAASWDQDRGKTLFEKPWLDRFLALLPTGGSILDIGCGAAEPIAAYFIAAGYALTGADSSAAMIDICTARFPRQEWVVADMRSLSLHRRFDGILAWDSFFHLACDDQRRMFPIFRAHAAPKAALMFTSGPRHGEATGSYRGEPLYHASLDEAEYRALLDRSGFEVIAHVAEHCACGGHTVWLARLR